MSRFGLLPISLATAALVVASACSGTDASVLQTDHPRDADAVSLAEISELATRRAREVEPDAVLRQVDVGPGSGGYSFRLTNAAATQAITLHAPSTQATPDLWELVHGRLTPLLGWTSPGIDVQALRIGPAAVERAAIAQWPGCSLRALTLVGQLDDLTWYVFCNVAEGVISGTVDGRTGELVPSPAPPALPPPTAVPRSQ